MFNYLRGSIEMTNIVIFITILIPDDISYGLEFDPFELVN